MMVLEIFARNGKLTVIAKDEDEYVGTLMQVPFSRGDGLQICLNELDNTEIKVNKCRLVNGD